ncbi:pre-rRNA-processing protein esf1 [Rhizophlyctis rosea]|nr:pre-rRNA-processing protein esf1 [Rhizophlyctis rosea]
MPPKSDKKKPKKPLAGGAPAAAVSDPRFARVHQDPRFARPKKDANKLKIDQRFASMLKSDEFGSGVAAPRVDKYGRKKKTTTAKELERFYKLEEDEEVDSRESAEEEEDEGQEGGVVDLARGRGNVESSDEGEEEEDEDEDEEQIAGYDLARGGVTVESSDEEEDDFSDAEDEAVGDGITVGPYAEENVPTGEETRRFAVVNLDWDHVKAKDLYKVFSGFIPPSGRIHTIKIYPSEFGKQRMEQEAREGPPKDIFGSSSSTDDLDKPFIRSDSGDDFDNTKLRKYQLERLKYYYAVVECDSVETARGLYKSCDGAEFEKSANFFDLRYIPEGMEFEDEPSDEASDAPQAYQPVDFVTLALQHSNVKLTWDEDDTERTKLTRRKFTKEDLKDMDFKAYLASSSSDDEDSDAEDAADLRAKLLGLTGDGDADEGDVFDDKLKDGEELEITFAPGLSEKAAKALERKKERESRGGESVFDAYLRKRKEKRKERKAGKGGEESGEGEEEGSVLGGGFLWCLVLGVWRDGCGGVKLLIMGVGVIDSSDDMREDDDPFFNADFGEGYEEKPKKATKPTKTKNPKHKPPTAEDLKSRAELELLFMDDNQDSRHFDMKEVIKAEKGKKGKKKKGGKKEEREGGVQDGFEVDVGDERFRGLVEGSEFAIDVTNPNFKRTQGMKKILEVRRSKASSAGEEVAGGGTSAKLVILSFLKVEQPPVARNNLSQLVDSVKRKSASALGGGGKGKRQKTR